AIRNVLRNRRRSAITALAVMLGCAAIVFLQGFLDAFVIGFLRDTVLSKDAPVQVHRRGFFDADDPIKLDLPQGGDLERRIRAVPGVTAVSARILFDGMVSNGSVSTMFVATAIDPANEYLVCPKRATQVAAGSSPLRPGRDNDVLMGRTLAGGLGADRGA